MMVAMMGVLGEEQGDNTYEGPLLSTFTQHEYDVTRGPQEGTYSFYFLLPHQQRAEQRNEDGTVSIGEKELLWEGWWSGGLGGFRLLKRLGRERVQQRYIK